MRNRLSVSLHLSGLKTFPAALNRRSAAADDAWTVEHVLPVVQVFGITFDCLSRMLVSCVSKYFKVLEKHFIILKVFKYQYKYLAYVLEYKVHQGLCLSMLKHKYQSALSHLPC